MKPEGVNWVFGGSLREAPPSGAYIASDFALIQVENRDGRDIVVKTNDAPKSTAQEMQKADLKDFLTALQSTPDVHGVLLPPLRVETNAAGELVEEYEWQRWPQLEHLITSIRRGYETGLIEDEDIVGMACHLLTAAEFIHGQGLIHHDIRPMNIHVHPDKDDNLAAQLFDYNVACRPYFLEEGQDVRNPEVPPEIRVGNVMVDSRHDIYMIGFAIRWLVYRYDMNEKKHVAVGPISPSLQAFLDATLAPHETRLASCEEARRILLLGVE